MISINYIYLLQERESVRMGENIYKVGMTKKINYTRFNQYPKGSILLFQMVCNNCEKIEKNIIDKFKNNFILKKDFGNEYFEGDYQSMIDIIYLTIKNEHDNEQKLENDDYNIYNSLLKKRIIITGDENDRIKITEIIQVLRESNSNHDKYPKTKLIIELMNNIIGKKAVNNTWSCCILDNKCDNDNNYEYMNANLKAYLTEISKISNEELILKVEEQTEISNEELILKVEEQKEIQNEEFILKVERKKELARLRAKKHYNNNKDVILDKQKIYHNNIREKYSTILNKTQSQH